MSFAQVLYQHRIFFRVEDVERRSERYPERTYAQRQVILTDMSGSSPVVSEILLPCGEANLDKLLVSALFKTNSKHPALAEWRSRKGHDPMRLDHDGVEEVGLRVQTALRKLGDGPLSSMVWQAMHDINRDQWAELLKASRQALRKLEKSGETVSHASVGLALKDVWTKKTAQFFDEGLARKRETPRRAEWQDLEDMAMSTLYFGCKMMQYDDWVHVWSAYLLLPMDGGEVAAKEPPPAQAAIEANSTASNV